MAKKLIMTEKKPKIQNNSLMRKISTPFLALILFVSGALAQNNNVVSAIKYHDEFKKFKDVESLRKAQARIDTAAKHPDTDNKAKTWYHRGEIYYTLFSYNWELEKQKARKDDQAKMTELEKKREAAKTEEEKNKVVAEIQALIKKHEEEAFQDVSLDELEASLESYKKCIEYDTKDDFSADAKKKITIFSTFFASKAVALYNGKRLEDAVAGFEKADEISRKYLGRIDTGSIDNAALTAGRAKMFDKAAELYNKLIAMNYKAEENLAYLMEIYRVSENQAKFVETVQIGRKKFPGNYNFIIEELNLYIKEGKVDEAIGIINLAIEKNPKNAELYLVKGQRFAQLAFPEGETKKGPKFDEYCKTAESSLLKANELKPGDPKILYSVGAFYNNWGAFIFNQAQTITDFNKLAVEEKKANEYFAKAIPFLEEVKKLDPKDKDALRALKQLYLKTGQAGTEKYKEVDNLLKN
jgi:hypothetical protein